MPTIFIDANIILGFWSLADGRVPAELLLPLVGLRNHVLITKQVADEINRNKLGVFLRNSDSAMFLRLPPEFPEHMMDARGISQFNKDLKTFNKSSKALNKKWMEIKAGIAAKISAGNDLPTQMLAPLLDMAKSPTEAQVSAARDRRERGNPPGKKADSLGDQISWEQFLDAVKGEETVWIISRDGDFAELLDKTRILKPFLRSELAALGIKHVNVFDSLAQAIKALQSAGFEVSGKIDEKELTELQKREEHARVPHPAYALWPEGPWQCPSCGYTNLTVSLIPRPSSYGGWSYWATCSRCRSQHDTGEPYDD